MGRDKTETLKSSEWKKFSVERWLQLQQRMRSPDREMLESKRRRDKSPSRMREEGDRPLMNHALRRRLEQVKKKREKARSRQKKYVQKLRASAGQMGILELGSVKEPQRRDYAKRLQECYEFVALHRLPIAKEDELDVACATTQITCT